MSGGEPFVIARSGDAAFLAHMADFPLFAKYMNWKETHAGAAAH